MSPQQIIALLSLIADLQARVQILQAELARVTAPQSPDATSTMPEAT